LELSPSLSPDFRLFAALLISDLIGFLWAHDFHDRITDTLEEAALQAEVENVRWRLFISALFVLIHKPSRLSFLALDISISPPLRFHPASIMSAVSSSSGGSGGSGCGGFLLMSFSRARKAIVSKNLSHLTLPATTP
jgi:hypothetical protein